MLVMVLNIYKMNNVTENLKELDYLTEATRFVLPMLYSTDRKDSFFINSSFRNCFVGDVNHPELQNKIFLLYKYKMSIDFIKFERSLELMSQYETDYDYSDEHQVMFVFNVPEEHEEDYQLFLQGRYSQFSEYLKQKILAFWQFDENSLFYSILYKTEKINKYWEESEEDREDVCIEGEYWYRPVLIKENFMYPD